MTTSLPVPIASGSQPGPGVRAVDVPATGGSTYPQPFASRVAGRVKRRLGDAFGLTNFGINLVTLAPGSASSVRHRHSVQDEFVYVLAGELVLVHDHGEQTLHAGMCVGFPAGGTAHHLLNRSQADACYLEAGDRLPGDSAVYPDDDLEAFRGEQGWTYRHKNGDFY
ncbi:cupin domain-containing protein [Sphingosinicella sp. BN140058]|uniref:cupin domain-containing protein n=1 Tax=Sphingosinicella sp. BN140058 TaxID=1892855 RepID=UPI001010F409|nr:cupin domain-containing protein [Sphingosinicella sp. BN140058]QAY78474.1 cupin domain-containing protein [Sphingosinicella sp. BN140058]